jgi:MFS family permease
VPVVLAVAFAAGLGAGAINPILGAVQFERVPRALQARVLGAIGAVAFAGIPLGGLAAGAAVGAMGLPGALVLAGGLYLAATLMPFVAPSWRGLDRPAAAPHSAARQSEAGASAAR